jgi:ATP-binding cassette, subfamily B, bacterial
MRTDKQNAPQEDLPPAWSSLWRTFRIGYRAEPRLLSLALGLALLMMVPDALLALWLKMIVDGVQDSSDNAILFASIGLAVTTTATWYLRVVSGRVQRRFRDKIAIALESHVARLQASVPTIEHHERPEYLDRLAMLRDQVFTLDHLFMSLFSTMGMVFRLVVTVGLLTAIHPVLILLVVFTLPTLYCSTWRPAVERRAEEAAISNSRLARHLFLLGTTASAGKEVRVLGIGDWLVSQRRETWERWYRPISRVRWATAMWNAAAWAVFAIAYVGAVVFVSSAIDRSVGAVVLVAVAGSRLAAFAGATAGELGFLRGFWMDSSRRLAWLEDYARDQTITADQPAPPALSDGIRFDHVSFTYPGTSRLVLDDVSLHLPAGVVVAIVGENGAGKSTLVKLLARMYSPTAGRITADGQDIATIDTEQWRASLAGAFQDFYKYEFRAAQTVGVGDLPHLDDRPAVEGAVSRAGADDVIDKFALGLDTQLGATWDAGVEVSFGQWQKLALARGFMRRDPLLLILDEPTAALDAETEHALFDHYASNARSDGDNGRITVMVSHRFSTVRMADLIVVLDGNKVAEVGSHEALMAADGLYAELYSIQAAAFNKS